MAKRITTKSTEARVGLPIYIELSGHGNNYSRTVYLHAVPADEQQLLLPGGAIAYTDGQPALVASGYTTEPLSGHAAMVMAELDEMTATHADLLAAGWEVA